MSFLLLDILKLKPGKTIEDATSYFDELADVFAEVGISRLDRPLKAAKVMRGAIEADYVNLFETADPQASMGAMQAHPEYQAKISTRDAIFDLENSTVLLTAKL